MKIGRPPKKGLLVILAVRIKKETYEQPLFFQQNDYIIIRQSLQNLTKKIIKNVLYTILKNTFAVLKKYITISRMYV